MVGYNWPMMSYGYGGVWGGLAMIVWWALVVAAIVFVVRWASGCRHRGSCHAGDEKSPMEILKERYAKGEIDRREFEEKKKDLA